MKILLLEDDQKLAAELRLYLQKQDFDCTNVYDGEIFFKEIVRERFDLYVLDINVPLMNGLEVCRRLRQSDTSTPILMLTAYGAVGDKVQALNYGADDYLVKPFHLEELLARVKALLRRSSQPQHPAGQLIEVADLQINTTEMKVFRAGREIALTPKEYKLLELLGKQKGRTVSKQTIAEQVWDLNFETGTNTIEVYISFLRNKIDKGHELPLIHTRPGFGYYLRATK
ncbi:response regulator transcription factor [Flaviaesturariibacter flavus]|uniref:Response regulator transcription factor n=1 Tax=Flaviaesturariibacter flavus TaxID=2502780 RepID=A0A4R1B3Y4_9BACT|nr:response regulator transcription factor [Flaviaesturariibacter flavus]TCJ12170.1 response regulator transcription factor [Flaviaesturariibacter flavus]